MNSEQLCTPEHRHFIVWAGSGFMAGAAVEPPVVIRPKAQSICVRVHTAMVHGKTSKEHGCKHSALLHVCIS